MMINWFKNLTSGYLWIALGILIAIVLGYIGLLKYQNNSLRADLAESKSQVAILSDSITTQNLYVNKLSEDTAKRTASAQEALNKAKAISVSKQSKINKLQAQLNNGDTCEQAVNAVKEQL